MIPKEAKQLMTFEGFNAKVNELKPYYRTRREAYDATEREHEYYFGEFKYSSYSSFLRCQNYHHNKSKQKVTACNT